MALQSDPRTSINQKTGGVPSDNTVNDRTIDGKFDRNGGSGRGKYTVSDHVYPNDLLSNTAPYGYNYVVFYINVAEDSRPIAGKKIEFVNDIDPREASVAQEAKLNPFSAGFGVFGQSAVAGGAIGAAMRSRTISRALSATVSGVRAAAVGSTIITGVVATQANDFSRSKKRMREAIMLHMPNQFKAQYSMSWGEMDMKNFMFGAQGAESLGNALKALVGQGPDDGTYSSNITGAIKQLGSAGAALALSIPTATGLQSATGMAPNPKKEMLFNGVNFRTFNMQYQFFPKNEIEANKVKSIIKSFKYHMHPEFKDAKKFLYLYPSEFDIYFYHKDEENRNIPRITSCVLIDVQEDYTPNGMFNSMKGGMPPQINVNLVFKELATLTKETIDKGY